MNSNQSKPINEHEQEKKSLYTQWVEMGTLNKIAITTIIVGGILLFVLPAIFSNPVIFKWFDLSESATLGDAIGGLTAPIIGMITAILMYLAFLAQIKANNELKRQISEDREKALTQSKIKQVDVMIERLESSLEKYGDSFNPHVIGRKALNITFKAMNQDVSGTNNRVTNSLLGRFHDKFSYKPEWKIIMDILYMTEYAVDKITSLNLEPHQNEYYQFTLEHILNHYFAYIEDRVNIGGREEIVVCEVCQKKHLPLPKDMFNVYCLLRDKIILLYVPADATIK